MKHCALAFLIGSMSYFSTVVAMSAQIAEQNPVTDYVELLNDRIQKMTKDISDKNAILKTKKADSAEAKTIGAEIKSLTDNLAVLTAQKNAQEYTATKVAEVTEFMNTIAEEAAEGDLADALSEGLEADSSAEASGEPSSDVDKNAALDADSIKE